MLDAGMTEPITKSGVAESLASFVRNLPDFRIEVLRYLARGSLLYMLGENTGTFRGERIAYPAVYAPLLRDGLVLRGRRLYDQAKLLAAAGEAPTFGWSEPTWTGAVAGAPARGSGDRVDPETFVRDYAATWKNLDRDSFALQVAGFYNTQGAILNPGMDEPIGKPQIPGYYQMVRSVAPDLTCKLHDWAGDAEPLCIEWVFSTGEWAGTGLPLMFRVAHVGDFEGRGIRLGCAYLGTLAIVCLTHPRVGKAPREFLG